MNCMNLKIYRDYCTVLECSDTEGQGHIFLHLNLYFNCTYPRSALCPQELCWSGYQASVMGRAGEKCPAGSTVREKVFKENNLKNFKSQKHNSCPY